MGSRKTASRGIAWWMLGAMLAWVLQGAAARAQSPALLLPSAVVYDSAGDLFFVDTDRNQVFEVSLAGVLTVVAGTGAQGFAGDGGAATSALLNAPQGIAVGSDGTVYIADTGNQRVRAVSGGQISTFAGVGTRGFSGDGGAATTAMLSSPVALAVDASGALLICDTDNQRVRRVLGGIIETLAGDGVQGFAGDGGAATAATLDSPAGVAVGPDGRVFVADSHNQRLRVVGTDGVIATFAGTGARGYAGDGGAATAAELFLPRGVSVAANGSVIFADSDNHRLRAVDANGNISTIAGAGWQGSASDGSVATAAALNTPRGVTVSSYGAPVFADTPNNLVREVAANGELYTVAVVSTPRGSSVSLSAPANSVYGQGVASVRVSGSGPTPQGGVVLLESGVAGATAVLANGSASLSMSGLSAGNHTVSAAFTGDGLNPATTSTSEAVTVSPASVVATANAATAVYGAAIPQLKGTLAGVLPQDASAVSAVFTTSATASAPVGIYPIDAALTGAASPNYSVSMSAASGSLAIVQAHSTVALIAPTQDSYEGLPLVLTAELGSATTGTPTGQVIFMDGAVAIATSTASNGVASGTYLAPAAGNHTLSAAYSGDHNFLAGTSPTIPLNVGAMPDFAMTAPQTSVTVLGGGIASFPLAVASVALPFTGTVTFSVSGLPNGVTASFTPAVVVPGSIGASVTMNVQTVALAGLRWTQGWPGAVALALMLPCWMACRRRRHLSSLVVSCCASVLIAACTGCGARNASTAAQASQSYTLTVRGTSTDLAGSVVAHSAVVTLVVQ